MYFCRRRRRIRGVVLRPEIGKVGIAERAMQIAQVHIGALNCDEALTLGEGSGSRMTALTTLKMAVLAPMPRPALTQRRREARLLGEHTQGVAMSCHRLFIWLSLHQREKLPLG